MVDFMVCLCACVYLCVKDTVPLNRLIAAAGAHTPPTSSKSFQTFFQQFSPIFSSLAIDGEGVR